jgi:hypothetical protein
MLKRVTINVFIVCFLTAILIDGLPTTSLFHGRLKAFIDPALDKVGLWQQSWQLFAPSVEKVNASLSATFTHEDGRTSTWESVDWSRKSLLRRFFGHREMEFFDAVKNDSNASAWPDLLRYVATHEIEDRGPLTHVVLTRHWNETPAPAPGDRQLYRSSRPKDGRYVLIDRKWEDLSD